MKTTIKSIIITGTVVGVFLTLAAGRVQAQVTNVILLTATSLSQQGANDDGTTTTTPAPNKTSVTTKLLLGFLARDEFAEGKYGATNFPAGSQLVVVNDHGCPYFQVLTASNTFLVDVSDIILVREGRLGNDIFSGKRNDATGLASTKATDIRVLTIGYDDSQVQDTFGDVVGLGFYMTGLMTSTTTDTAPTSAKVYTETHVGKMTTALGEGIYQGRPFVISGSLNVSGKGTFTLP